MAKAKPPKAPASSPGGRPGAPTGSKRAQLASFEQAERVYAAHADPFRGPALRLHRAQRLVAHGRADEVRDTLAPIIDALEQGLGAQAWDTRQAILLAGTLGAAAPRPR